MEELKMEVKKSTSEKRWDIWQELLQGHFGVGDPLSLLDEQETLKHIFKGINPKIVAGLFNSAEELNVFLDRVDHGESVEDLISEKKRKTPEFAILMNMVSRATQVVLLRSGNSGDEPIKLLD